MPQKKGRHNNKKKKGKHSKGPVQATPGPQTGQRRSASRDESPLEWDNTYNNEAPPVVSLYTRYKQATESFKEALKKLLPDESPFKVRDDVQSLVDTVDCLTTLPSVRISSSLMKNLATAIRVRMRVSAAKGSDSGHSYFIAVLNYCWVTLDKIREGKASSIDEEEEPENRDDNPFSILTPDDEDEDDDLDDILPEKDSIRRPVKPEKEISLRELVSGSDYFRVHLFFITMDEMMGYIITKYQGLKRDLRHHMPGRPESSYVEHVVECTMYANGILREIQRLENSLQLEHEHLNTVYRMLAVLLLQEHMDFFEIAVKEDHGSSLDLMKPKDLVKFFGDALECAFRNPSDLESPLEVLKTTYASMWKLPCSFVEETIEQVNIVARTLLAPIAAERAINTHYFTQMSGIANPQELVFAACPNLCGDRSFLNTLRLLQGMSNAYEHGLNLVLGKTGMFGKLWQETKGSARAIAGDLDELLMRYIFPVLLPLCGNGKMSHGLPMDGELMPLFVLLRQFTQSKRKRISVALAFGMQVVLTSIFEIQGSDDVKRVASMTRDSFSLFMEQCDDAVKKRGRQSPHWNTNIAKIQSLRTIATCLEPHSGTPAETTALWNPFVGGMYVTYLIYFASLAGGSACVDSMAQLRMFLHLLNACVQTGAIILKEYPFLDLVYSTFSDSKAIWVTKDKPVRGGFVKHFCMAFGSSRDAAMDFATKSHEAVAGSDPNSLSLLSTNRASMPANNLGHRSMVMIEPEHMSKSFRRMVLGDFSGMVDKYHTSEQRKKGKGKSVYETAVRLNTIADDMDEEQEVLAVNWVLVSAILNEFTSSLFDVMEWKPFLDHMVNATPATSSGRWENSEENIERQAMTFLFAYHLLGVFDIMDPTQMPPKKATRAAAFLIGSATRTLAPGTAIFFTPVKEVVDD